MLWGDFEVSSRQGGEETAEWRVCTEPMTFRVKTLVLKGLLLVEPQCEGHWGLLSYQKLAGTVSMETAGSLAEALPSPLSDRYKHSLILQGARKNSFNYILPFTVSHPSPPSVSYLLALSTSPPSSCCATPKWGNFLMKIPRRGFPEQ